MRLRLGVLQTCLVETNERAPYSFCALPVILNALDKVVIEFGQIIDIIRVVQVRPFLFGVDTKPVISVCVVFVE
jgi:hypothetical protein